MRASELRIGNLVYTDRIEDNELVVINTISYHPNYKDYLLSTNHFPHLTLHQCKPIPLTEEWLVKFGFVDLYNDPVYCSIDSNGKISVSVSYSDEAHPYLIHIKYFHQLQNLYFSLTGEELKLKEEL